MRIFIIGGTGFSGPHIVRSLVGSGNDVLLFHRGKSETELPPGVSQIYGDRRKLKVYADDLLHFAPQVVLDMVASRESDAQDVMEIFKGTAQRIVAISSQDVYRAYGVLIHIEAGPIEEVPLDEDAPLRDKLYPYRESVTPDHRYYDYEKILVERRYMEDPELPGTIIRYPMVYGPGDYQHRTFEYLKRMDDGRPAILLEEGSANWRWTKGYVENMAAGVVLAVTDQRAAGRIYNIGESRALTEAQWVGAIGRASGWKGKVIVLAKEQLSEHLVPDHNTGQDLVTDTRRIREELGYEEVVSQDEALRRTIEWERAHPPEEVDAGRFDYKTEDALLDNLANPLGRTD